jgi:hypothetical protein
MATPTSGTISIGVINSVFGRGNNLNAYRGTVWYQPNSLVTGNFSSGAISLSDFYNKQPNDPATTGSQTFSTPGTTTFTIPLFRNTLTVEVWGGGGGGGGYGDPGTGSYASGAYFGATGNQSYFNAATYANGGVGGQNAGTDRFGGLAFGAGGAGGTAAGVTTATAGNTGGSGPASSTGAGAPNGGGDQGTNSANGTMPGGGGAGFYYTTGGKFPAVTGGGGSGGYAKSIFTPSTITAGAVLNIIVGAGGLALTGCAVNGGNGADGKIYIVWS